MFGRLSEHDVGDADLIAWVKDLPLSRTMGKTAIDLSSEFDDGVCLAELFNYFKPGSVDLASFYNEFNRGKKNWLALHKKFLKAMQCGITSAEVEAIIKKKPDALPVIERILRQVRSHLEGDAPLPKSEGLKKTTSSSGRDRVASKDSARLMRMNSKTTMKKGKSSAEGKKAAMRNKEKKKEEAEAGGGGEPKRKASLAERLKGAVFGTSEKAETNEDEQEDLGSTLTREGRSSSATSLQFSMSKDIKVG
jgi:hypothetical protein